MCDLLPPRLPLCADAGSGITPVFLQSRAGPALSLWASGLICKAKATCVRVCEHVHACVSVCVRVCTCMSVGGMCVHV